MFEDQKRPGEVAIDRIRAANPDGPQKVSTFAEATDDLSKAIEMLHRTIERLGSKLQPVLVPVPTEKMNEAVPAPPCSLITSFIREKTQQVKKASSMIIDLIDQTEL